MSMDRSRNDSSRDDTCQGVYINNNRAIHSRKLLTVSQVRHLVSLVKTPSNSLWTRVASWADMPEFEFEFELGAAVGRVAEKSVPTELDT